MSAINLLALFLGAQALGIQEQTKFQIAVFWFFFNAIVREGLAVCGERFTVCVCVAKSGVAGG